MAASGLRPRVFSIAAGAPFLDVAARALIDGTLAPALADRLAARDPLALSDATIYVPTRRSARALASAIAKAWGGRSVILPRIAPLGALDSGDAAWPTDAEEPRASLASIAPAFSDIERRMQLAPLAQAFGRRLATLSTESDGEPRAATTPADAWSLAGDLGGLIDEMIVEGLDWSRLDSIVDDHLDSYWQLTRDFLLIARENWPNILAEKGRIDAAQRRALLIAEEAKRLASDKGGPVIALGSTGTNASTAELLRAIAWSPRGGVVLPGLDLHLDEAGWTAIGAALGHAAPENAGHPQAALQRLLGVLQVERRDVATFGEVDAKRTQRERLLGEAMRPAATTDAWRAAALAPEQAREGLESVALIEAHDEREEALAIAIALRETLEAPGATAALVTPDRALARRVRAELARWSIHVEDSAGETLAETAAGRFARLALACVEEGFNASSLIALLAHPDLTAGRAAGAMDHLRGATEIAALRGVTPRDCLADVAATMEAGRARGEGPHAHRALKALSAADWRAVEDLLTRLKAAFAPLAGIEGEAGLARWIEAHRAALLALGDSSRDSDDLAARDALFDELLAASSDKLALNLADYSAFFTRVASERVLRAREDGHPRLSILGLLEARLIPHDFVVLGGLDETIWPPQTTTDAFLNRPMRHQIGLSSPERRIGQTAHDFVMAMGAARVLLTRAGRRGGAPMTPSRFLQRLQAVAGEAWSETERRGATWLDLARRLDATQRAEPAPQPRPCPPVALRPDRLSVTRIETLRRDPYAIYAARILELAPLDEAGQEEGGRETGDAIHEVIARFIKAFPSGLLPPNARDELMRIAEEVFEARLEHPHFRRLEWPRHLRALMLYFEWEARQRSPGAQVVAERNGSLAIPLADGSSFKLTAQADRISLDEAGALSIVDFKTGAPPSPADVIAGFAPQLTLEAAMAQRAAFEGLAGADAVSALYVKLGGGEGLDEKKPAGTKHPFDDLPDAHHDGLARLLSAYRDATTPYVNRPWPGFVPKHDDYAHLARVKEWSMTGGGAEGGGDE